MKRMGLIVLLVAMLLIGCNKTIMQPTSQPETTPPIETSQATQSPATEETTQPTEPTLVTEPLQTTPATEPEQTEPKPTEPKPTEPKPTEPNPTEALPTDPPTQPTEAATEPPQPEEEEPDLGQILAKSGYTYDDLAQKGCTQLITVQAVGSNAQICLFWLDGEQWKEKTNLSASGFVGRNGVSSAKKEGDGCTPAGLYSISTGFYIASAPETGLELFKITDQTYWVDDPNSAYYNQRVEGTENQDWNSAEKMGKYKTDYKYGFVVDYNTDCVPGAGSAIFFHVGGVKASSGCITVKEKLVLQYLSFLDADCSPHILIQGE